MQLTKNNTSNWFVYIIEAENGFLYTGITTSIEKRFLAHKTNKGAKFFNTSAPKKIVYIEKNLSHQNALKREHAIKALSRKQKIDLVTSQRAI